MIKRTTVLTALLFAAAVAPAATFADHQVIFPVPAIPHGLDWNMIVAPDFQIHQKTLAEAEVRQILPPILALGRLEGALTLGPVVAREQASMNPLIPIIAGTVLLLAAYDLIPRAHSRILRFRSVDLNRDLFS